MAGFLFGSKNQFLIFNFLCTIAGLAAVIASACVFNNYLDRNIDRKMLRTKQRALATGSIKILPALIMASSTGIVGFALLAMLPSKLALGLSLFGYIVYIGAYGYTKRKSSYGTLVGALAGATPPSIGYLGATGSMDSSAILLFLILFSWQMPHFYSIAIKRLDEYKAASIPVLPAIRSVSYTRMMIEVWLVIFIIFLVMLSLVAKAGHIYLAVMLLTGLWWLNSTIKTTRSHSSKQWSAHVFVTSLKVLMIFSAMIAVDGMFL